MDELSGLLLTGGVFLAASIFTAAHTKQDDEQMTDEVNETSVSTQDQALNARIQYDKEYSQAVDNSKVLVLSRGFQNNFTKLQDALKEIPLSTEEVKIGLYNYLVVDLSSLLATNHNGSAEEDLFKLLVSNDLLVTPGKCFDWKQNGRFFISSEVSDNSQLEEIVDRFKNVITLAQRLKTVGTPVAEEGSGKKEEKKRKKHHSEEVIDNTGPFTAATAASKVASAAMELAEGSKEQENQILHELEKSLSSAIPQSEDETSVTGTRRGRKRTAPDSELKKKKKV
jgi:hypothetical protein